MRALLFILILAQLPTFPKGCSEFYPDEPAQLRIVQASGSTVELAWDPVEGASGYRVLWRSTNGPNPSKEESTFTTELNLTIDSLGSGKEYTFELRTLDKGVLSSSASTTWTSPSIHTTEPHTGNEIRLHELSAPMGKGSGLILDPKFGGPVSTGASASNPDVYRIQIIGLPESTELAIGPSKGFTKLAAAAQFPTNVVVSDTFFVVQSIAEWMIPNPLDTYFAGNRKKPFEHISSTQPSGKGIGFFVRVGTPPGEVHYARVFVKPDAQGTLVRTDDEGILYIVLEVVWQTKPNYPYV